MAGIVDVLIPAFPRVVVTQTDSDRALPAEELEILGQVADDEDPQLCLTFGEYWEYYTVTGRTTQPRYAHGNRKNTAWVLAAPLDWAAVEGYFPAP